MARGALPKLFKLASQITEQQHQTITRHLDEMSTADDPSLGAGTGGTLSRQNHLILLATNQQYQSDQLAKMPWMTKEERAQTRRDLVRALQMYPEAAPPSVGAPPASPMGMPPPETPT